MRLPAHHHAVIEASRLKKHESDLSSSILWGICSSISLVVSFLVTFPLDHHTIVISVRGVLIILIIVSLVSTYLLWGKSRTSLNKGQLKLLGLSEKSVITDSPSFDSSNKSSSKLNINR